MTFTPLKPRQMRVNDPVCVSLVRRLRPDRAVIMFKITVSPRLAADLKWKAGDRLEVAVGEGQDAGYVRFRPAPEASHGYTLKASGNTSRRLKIECTYWGAETKFAQAPCDARPDTVGRTLTIELPWQRRIARAAE